MPVQRLTGQQYQQFSEALRDAFNEAGLRRMLRFRLERNLDDIVIARSLEELVFEVIGTAEAEGWTDRLLRAARESNPGNAMLLAFSQQFGLAPTDAPSRPALERLIRTTNTFLDVPAWRSKLGQLETQVCRIEVTTNGGVQYGTGFLLGPDVVMTNYHVMEAVIKGEQGGLTASGLKASRADVVLRFDYKRMDGSTLNPGTEHRLAEEGWLIDDSPPSPADSQPEPKTAVPQTDELDYALLRLAVAAGTEHVGGAGEGAQRGWVEVPVEPHVFLPGSALFIMQHPDANPLQLALDTDAIRGVNDNGTRVTYRTNTLGGSSGSPCFNHNWDLVALHHSGDPNFDPAHKPDYNEGIPIAAIIALLRQHKLTGVLGAQQL
jgi:hypothetical protein